jgi:hypothetical protein
VDGPVFRASIFLCWMHEDLYFGWSTRFVSVGLDSPELKEFRLSMDFGMAQPAVEPQRERRKLLSLVGS